MFRIKVSIGRGLQSPGSSVHITVRMESFVAVETTQGLRNPYGGRNHSGGPPRTSPMASAHSFNSFFIAAGLSQKRFGCVCVWLAIKCPRAAVSRTRSGHSRANLPITKNVALALYLSSRSNSWGVRDGFGPSSNVMASLRGEFVQQRVLPNSCARESTAPYATTPAEAAATVETIGRSSFIAVIVALAAGAFPGYS